MLAPEFLRGLRPLLRLVLILLGDRLHLRLQHLHLLRRECLLAAHREHRPADEHGQQQDRDSVVADHGMERVEHGDHRAGHPAKPAVVDEVVHPRGLRTILCQQFGLLWTGKDLVAVGHRGARIDRQFLRDESTRDIDELAAGRGRDVSHHERPHLVEGRDIRTGRGRNQRGGEVEGIDAGERQRFAVADSRGRMVERTVGHFEAAHQRALLAGKPHRHVADRERAPVSGDPRGIPPAFGRQAGGAVEGVGDAGGLFTAGQFDHEFEPLCWAARGAGPSAIIGGSRHEPVFLGHRQPTGQSTGEPHHAAIRGSLRLPVTIGQFLARDLEQRLRPLAVVTGFERQPK